MNFEESRKVIEALAAATARIASLEKQLAAIDRKFNGLDEVVTEQLFPEPAPDGGVAPERGGSPWVRMVGWHPEHPDHPLSGVVRQAAGGSR